MKKCIFLDRDGVINKHEGLLISEEQLHLEEDAVDAVKMINESEYMCVIVTNQSVIARGFCTNAEVENINNKLIDILRLQGAYVDDIFYCPHYVGKNNEYTCNCRKPQTGMIDAAKEKYNIDLTSSWIIGDMTTDIQMGKNAGLNTILVKTGRAGRDGICDASPDIIAEDILDAVEYILNMFLKENRGIQCASVSTVYKA